MKKGTKIKSSASSIKPCALRGKQNFAFYLLLITSVLLASSGKSFAQTGCSGVPTYTVDFTGNPSGTFSTPSVQRAGNCCGTSSPDRCLHFDITFDSLSAAVDFQVTSGSMSPGALFYQIDCGPQTAVGVAACITGGLHHDLTFCKPGNNTNTYLVTSIPQVVVWPHSDSLRVGCSKSMHVIGVVDSTVSWNSIYPGASGAYNGYLSCTTACNDPVFTPTAGAPSYIDYQLSGYPKAQGCGYGATVYDTVRMYVYPALTVTVTPNPGYYCTSGVALNSTVSGGYGTKGYTWKDGGNNTIGVSANYFASSAGTYSVVVTDQLSPGCASVTATVPVNQSNTTLTPVITHVSCNGAGNGTVAVGASNGVSPYAFHWATGATTSSLGGLSAGTYNLTVTDNGGCTKTTSITVTQPTVLTITVDSVIHIACRGNSTGRVYITPSGATAPYSYVWSNGGFTTRNIVGLSAGTYNVTVTDFNGCTASTTATVTQPATVVPVVNAAGSSVNLSCYNDASGSAAIDSSTLGGTQPYAYLWSTGQTTPTISGLQIGTYVVTITDANGCIADTAFTLTQPDSISTSFNSFSIYAGGANVSCNGAADGAVDFNLDNGGTPLYTYSWNGGSYTTQDLNNVPAGVYQVVVTDAHGCTATNSISLSEPGPITPSISSPLYAGGYNIACKGENSGRIFSTVTGGTPSYTMDWTGPNGFTGTDSNFIKLYAGVYSVTITDLNGCTDVSAITLTEPSVIVPLITAASINGVNIRCHDNADGLAYVDTVWGGTAPYAFTWDGSVNNDSLENVSVGTHLLHISDANGCVLDTSIYLDQPDPITSQVSTSSYGAFEISCNAASDGAINVDTVFGGVPPYTYNWASPLSTSSSSISGLSAGVYGLVISDNNGCQDSIPIALAEPGPITNNPSTTDVACNGAPTGSISVGINGGTSNYSYLWNTGDVTPDIYNLTAGNYCVQVTDDNGCVYNACYTLTEPVLLSIDSITSTVYNGGWTVSCNGGTNGNMYSFINGGVQPYTYNWSNGDTSQNSLNVSVTTYYLTVTDANGCNSVNSITLAEPPLVQSSIVSQIDVACYGDSSGAITFSTAGGTNPYRYSIDGVNFTPDSTFTNLSLGSYILTTLDTNDCSYSMSFTINQPAGSLNAQLNSQNNVGCFGGSNGSVDISAVNGVPPYQYTIDSVTFQGTGVFTNLGAGTYHVLINDNNGCSYLMPVTITQPSAVLNSSSSFTDVNCFNGTNGTAMVNPTGGTIPYFYSWSTGDSQSSISNLTAGTYSFTVTDLNNCSTIGSITITEPAQLTLPFTQTNVSCNGGNNGSVMITTTGGTSGYFYDWMPLIGNSATIANLTVGVYSCTVTDANNCTAIMSTAVAEPSALTATSAEADVLCNGGNTGSAAVAVSGGISGYSYYWSPGASTNSAVSNLTIGTYAYTVTDANGCMVADSVVINEPPLLSTATNHSDVLCNGGNTGSAGITANGGTTSYNYLWSNGDMNSQIINLAAQTYFCTVTDANGCTVQDIVTITEPNLLTVSSNQTDILCNGGNNGSITLTSSGGTSNYLYGWSPAVSTDSTANSLMAGPYSFTVTDANGCSVQNTVTISEPTPLSVSSVQADVLCNGGNTGSITLTTNGGVTPYNYLWSNGDTQSSISNLTVSTYTVTITDGNGCLATTTIDISEPALLTITPSHTDAVCNGALGSASVTASGGIIGYSYTWSTGSTDSTVTGLAANTYSCTISDANSCSATISIIITEASSLTVVASQSNINCNGGNNGVATITATGGIPNYTYTWSSGGTDSSVTGLVANSYTCTVTDGNGCSSITTVTITEPSILTTSVAPDAAILCNGGNTTVTVTATGGTSTYNGTGTFTVNAGTYSYTVSDANGCTSMASVTVTEPAVLSASANVAGAISCNGGSTTINVVGGGGTIPYSGTGSFTVNIGTYNYTITDNNSCTVTCSATITEPTALSASTALSANISCFGATTTIIVSGFGGTSSYNGTGTFTITAGNYNYTITDNNGCTASTSVNVTEPTAIAGTISSTNATCNGISDGTATVSISGGTLPYNYYWSPNVGSTSMITGLSTGSYSCSITDANNCNYTLMVTVTQPGLLTTDAGANQSICGNVTILNAQQLNGQIGIWNITSGAGNFDNSNSATATVSDLNYGSNTLVWNITDASGCIASDTLVVDAYEQLTAAGGPDSVFCPNDFTGSIILRASDPTPGTGVWSKISGNGTIMNPNSSTTDYTAPIETSTHILLWTVTNGVCSSSDTVIIEVKDDGNCLGLDLPSGFTPNGDGHNDEFVIHGIEKYPVNTFIVFNRWGNEVFRRDNYSNADHHDWAGENVDGKPLPDGTYYVVLVLNKGEIVRNTFVDMRR